MAENEFDIHKALALLRVHAKKWNTPAVTVVAECGRSPFKVLVSCVLSLRTKDAVTAAASSRLFEVAETPEEMVKLPADDIARLIYPVGFYRTKSVQILGLSRTIIQKYGGTVPSLLEELLSFKGVGRKTANLVMTLGFGKPGICVDIHVHRICNRWGYVSTASPDRTEMTLRAILPSEYWIEINDLLVAFGQNQCRPVSPFCTTCCLNDICPRIGVGIYR